MKKKWILLFSVTVCILLICFFIKDVSAGCWSTLADEDGCSKSDTCKGTGNPYWYKRDYDGSGGTCKCRNYGGTLLDCGVSERGLCYVFYQCQNANCTYRCVEKKRYPESMCIGIKGN